tara:strand:- start:3112 stop:3462 length:351 start_codon:yes stop_codon:yes gene_type:complete
MENLETYKRPWGTYKVIYHEPSFKLKRIEVNPGHRLSYQYHKKRSEVWTIVKGSGEIIIDGNKRLVKYGDCVIIHQNSKHRIANNSDTPLVFIEVQTGSYFGEDDIVRIEDDYKRI